MLRNTLQRVTALPAWAQALLVFAAPVVLGLSILLSPLVVVLALIVLIVAILVLVVRLLRGRPLSTWGVIAGASFVVLLVFTGISNALYFGGQSDQASQPGPQEQAEKPEANQEPLEQTEKQGGVEEVAKQEQKAEERPQEVEKKEKQAGIEASPAPSASATAVADKGASGPTVKITRAVDGDTLEISPKVDGKDTVRLIGIDAPEEATARCRAQPLAEEATFEASLWEGLRVRLEFDEDRTDQYGRLLAYVHDPVIGEMMNAEMLRSGYAQVYIVTPNTEHEDELRKAQKEAKELAMGYGHDVWSLSPEKDRLLADHGNGIGQGDGACRPKPEPKPQPTATATASPNATASPDPNRDYDDSDPNAGGTAPSTASPGPGGAVCEPPAYAVPPGHPGDGDNDGCAGEE